MKELVERERAIEAERHAVVEPHRQRIRELRRLIAIEEEHIEMKGKAVRRKSASITFVDTYHPR